MKINEVVTTPLWIPYEQPFHWSQGVTHGAEVILVEVHTDEGVVGYGESIATPSAEAVRAHLSLAADFASGAAHSRTPALLARPTTRSSGATMLPGPPGSRASRLQGSRWRCGMRWARQPATRFML